MSRSFVCRPDRKGSLVLDQTSVLVVEDEPYIALDLAFAIEDAGGRVVGPAGSVAETLTLMGQHEFAAAILDANLSDGDISPVVEILVGRGVPFIVQTGIGLPTGLSERFPDLVVHIKPCLADWLVGELVTKLMSATRTGVGS